MCTSFSIFIKLYNHQHYLIPEHLHQLKKKHCIYQQPFLILPILQPLATINLLFCLYDLPVTDILYEWNYTICDLLCLASSPSMMFSRFICIVACIGTAFFFIAEQYSIVWMYHIYLSLHWFMNILVVSTYLLLRIMVLWTFMYGFCVDICFQVYVYV